MCFISLTLSSQDIVQQYFCNRTEGNMFTDNFLKNTDSRKRSAALLLKLLFPYTFDSQSRETGLNVKH